MPAKTEVLGIGNAIVDVLARVDDTLLDKRGLTKGTMQLIDEPQAEALYGELGPAVEMSGGSGANTIAGLAGLGIATGFIGKVRNDQLGKVFTHDIRATGTRFDTTPASEGPATARCLVMITPDGERTMNTFLGASAGLGPEDIAEAAIAGADTIYLEGYLWDPPHAKAAFKKAAQIARDNDRQVALTLSDTFCVERHRESFLELIRSDVDILFANEREIMALYETDDFDEAASHVRKDAELAVLTRSEKGSLVLRDGEAHAVKAHRVERVVDATGAGDLFAAGFLAGLARGKSLVQCAELGALAAAEIISHVGARAEADLKVTADKAGLL